MKFLKLSTKNIRSIENEINVMSELTKSEMEIMHILWEDHPLSIQEIHDRLQRERGYTNTLKLVQIMFSKELLLREKSGKKHLYSPAISTLEAQQMSMEKFKGLKHEGSRIPLVLGMLGGEKVSDSELEELKKFIEQQSKK